ncbi:MAG: amidase [Ignavibacteriales bacterium]|nr:amidase [Ignavibacteriales bacterium]
MKYYCLFILATIFFITQLSLNAQGVSKENIENAEKIIDLHFTDAERDSMLSSLEEQKGNYKRIRDVELDNSVMPSLLFNPIPVGFIFPQEQNPIKFSDYSNIKMPFNKDELAFYTIGQLAELIKTKQISSTELTKFFIERLKKLDPTLYCVVSFTEERALREAKIADEEIALGKYRGLLHGIPFAVKDLLATKDYKTTWGAMPYKDQIIDEDATVITKLENAGAILIAKLSMGALAWGDVWFGGKTRNPWDTTSGSSGSSAGSAASVSAGLVPFAIGTETYGSIVSPSTVCGTTGLRPTYGRVSRTGAMALSWSMDKIGPICRSAEDLAIVFNAIYGVDGVDQTLYDVPFTYNPVIDIEGLKVGYLKKDFDKLYDFHNNDSITLAKLKELGVELIPIELPDYPVNDLTIILSAEAGAAFDELTRSNKDDLLVRQIKNAWPNSFRASRFIPAVEYINASRIRTLLIQEMQKLMSKIDLFIAPSDNGDSNIITNLTGHPCVVLPNGFSDNGTPTSITFIGRLFDEGRLIAFAKLYQDATDFHKKHPAMFK